MSEPNAVTFVAFAALGSGLAGAFCWLKSAAAEGTRLREEPGPDGFVEAIVIVPDDQGRQTELSDLLQKQAKWNKLGAVWTAFAVFFQALIPFLQAAQ
jgi:hypothetical protein